MSGRLRIILIVLVVLTNLYSVRQIRRGKMNLNHSLLWIFISLALLLVAIFPDIAFWISEKIGIGLPINMVFLSFSLFSIILFIYLTNVVSRTDQTNRRLTQQVALLEKRIRELEAKTGAEEPRAAEGEKAE